MTVAEVIDRLEKIQVATRDHECPGCNLAQALIENLAMELQLLLVRRRES